MTKYINFRYWFIIVIAVIISIALGVALFVSTSSKLVAVVVSAMFAFVFILLTIIFKTRVLFVFASIFICCLIIFSGLFVKAKRYDDYSKFNEELVLISGRIDSRYSFTSSGNLKIVLDDVSFSYEGGYEEIKGKVTIFTSPEYLDLTEFEIGMNLEVLTTINIYSFEENLSDNIYYLSNNYVGYSYVSSNYIYMTDSQSLSLRDILRNAVYNKLSDSETEFADVGYAMLFGDSNYIDSDVISIFRSTGIAHILAVSGLHVSMITSIIAFILKKLKISLVANLIINTIILIFYMYLCAFSVSVVRASLMAIIGLFCTVRGKAYDRLSVLSFVATLILLVNPLKLFNASFILSFTAVLSITFLIFPLFRVFNKVFYKKFAESLALCVGVQIGIFVIQMFYFGQYSLLSIPANLISIPLTFVAFAYLIFSTIVVFIIPPASILIKPFGWVMGTIVRFNNWISSLGLIINFENVILLSIITSYLVIFFFFFYIFVKRRWKVLASLTLVLICSLIQLII